MPLNYTRKSERGIAKFDEMLTAVRHIKRTGESIRKTAESFGINYKTLSRYRKKFSDEEIKGEDSFPTTTVGYTRNRCTRNHDRRVSSKSIGYLFWIITKGMPKTCLQIC